MDYVITNIFPSASEPAVVKEEHFLHILTDIQSDKYKDLIKAIRATKVKTEKQRLKKSLPCFTACSTFNVNREIKNVKSYNGIVILDIDGISGNQARFLKIVLARDKYVSCIFISPSEGLKVFVQVDNNDPKEHRKCFEQVKDYIEGHYANYTDFKVDVSGKDVSRLCFVSWDPEAYYSSEAGIFEVDLTKPNPEDFKSVKTIENVVITHNSKKIFERCMKMVKASKTGGYRAGNRNNYIYCLSRLMNDFGIPHGQAETHICNQYPSLGFKEITTTINSAYKAGRGSFGTKQMFSSGNNEQQGLL